MKKNIGLLLLTTALIAGCTTSAGTTSPTIHYRQSHIRVVDNNNHKKDYSLLSIRDDKTLVVLDWTEAGVYPIPFSHAIVLSKDSISEIDKIGGSEEGGLIGALSMASAGILATWIAAIENPKAEFGSIDGGGSQSPPGIGILINYFVAPLIIGGLAALPGYAIGSIAGEIASPSKPLYPELPKDWKYLRQISTFPDKEPPEMQYIK